MQRRSTDTHAAAEPAQRRADGTSAFTLIELLVATTILVVIVMMTAMVFHNSSLAWDSGMRKAQAGMLGRAVLGSLVREMSQAVDGGPLGLSGQQFSGSSVKFFVLKPTDRNDPNSRALRQISYSYAGGQISRRETEYRWSGSAWVPGPTTSSTLAEANDHISGLSFEAKLDPNAPNELPLYVDIRMDITQGGTVSYLGAWSYGPNGQNEDGLGDDITSW